jgi:murein DD-endopeptidase MepM/ murein hydrolase activator NlpD
MIIKIKSSILFFFTLCSIFSLSNCKNNDQTLDFKELSKKVIDYPHFKKIHGFSVKEFIIDSNTVKNGQSFSQILQEHKVSYEKIHKLGTDFRSIYDIRNIFPGDKYYTVFRRDSNVLSNLVYQHSLTEIIVISFLDSLRIKKIKKTVERRILKVGGKISTSLWQSLIDKKLSPALVSKIASLYSWTIDFFDIQPNDSYKIIYESRYVDNKFLATGDIKAILFNHKGKDFYAFKYLPVSKKVENYFNETGESMQRALLSAPLEYKRISSKFSHRRLHPIKKIYRPHYGVDYAAPSGTDVVSTGDGKVIFAARSRGAGNMIKIKHAFGNVVTKYLHLLKFEKGIKVGSYVEQGEKIGEVGSTGLSTGPHLDYRVYINGKPQNPLKLNVPSKDPIQEDLKAQYSLDIAEIKSSLDSIIVQ